MCRCRIFVVAYALLILCQAKKLEDFDIDESEFQVITNNNEPTPSVDTGWSTSGSSSGEMWSTSGSSGSSTGGMPEFFIAGRSSHRHVPPVNAIVEVAIVCDKEFGTLFQHNRQKIIDYFSVYFWDISMRFKTLPSSNISFRITSVVMIATTKDQPFIENAKNETTGQASLARIKPLFASWLYSQLEKFPPFDIAILFTNADLDSHGAKGHFEAACVVDDIKGQYLGSFVVSEHRGFSHVETTTQHIALLLGAHWDQNALLCTAQGYIMSNAELGPKTQFFFSSCTDLQISKFIRSDLGACLRRIDAVSSSPQVDPDYNSALAPNMQEQCQAITSDPRATVGETDDADANCQEATCWIGDKINGPGVPMYPVDNTDALNGKRCFRGRSIQNGLLLVNVGSGECLLSRDRFSHNDVPTISTCPRSSTPFDRVALLEDELLTVPFSSRDGIENSDKCLWGIGAKNAVEFERCNSSAYTTMSPLQWDLITVANEEFLLFHRLSKKCAKQTGHGMKLSLSCNRKDPSFRWRFEMVLPSPGMCEENKCQAHLVPYAFFRNVSESNRSAILDIRLTNLKGVAISPGVIISWNKYVKLLQVPHRCLFFSENSNSTAYKCKLDRLLEENEKVLLVSLSFVVENIAKNDTKLHAISIKMLTTSASQLIQQESKSLIIQVRELMLGKKDSQEGWSTSKVLLVVIGSIVATLLVVAAAAGGLYWFYFLRGIEGERREYYGVWTNRIKAKGGSSGPPTHTASEMKKLRPQSSQQRQQRDEERYKLDDPPHRPMLVKQDSSENHIYEEIGYGGLLYDEDNYLQPLPDINKRDSAEESEMKSMKPEVPKRISKSSNV